LLKHSKASQPYLYTIILIVGKKGKKNQTFTLHLKKKKGFFRRHNEVKGKTPENLPYDLSMM
jgi:hypothetical protein